MYDLDKLLSAIWQNPNTCTGLQFEQKGNAWQTRQRPDGSSDTHPYTVLKTAPDRHTIFVNYNGAQFQNGDIWQLLKYLYNTNDFSDVVERVGRAYGIEPEYNYKSEEHKKRAERRRAQADVIQSIATFLLQQLNTDAGAAARDYLKGRGLQPSERIGAYSKAIHAALLNQIQKKYADTFTPQDIEAIVKDNLPAYNPDDYAVVLPYYNGTNKVTGFYLRRTATAITYIDKNGEEKEKPKHLFSYAYAENNRGTFAKGGYCLNLNSNTPAILVEGLLDAESIRQAAIAGGDEYKALQNVFAVGGIDTQNSGDDDAAKNQIATLQRFGIKHIIFIPDYEYNSDGTLRTTGADKTIAAILPYIKQELTGNNFRSLRIADLTNADGCKDADDYVRHFGISNLQEVVEKAEAWYKWKLRNIVREHAADTTPDAMAAAAIETYKHIEADTCRQLLRAEFTEPKAENYIQVLKKQAGVTVEVLARIDSNGEAPTWRSMIKAAASKFCDAVEKNATREEVGTILNEAQRAQNFSVGNKFAAQVNATREDMHAWVRQKPEPLQTCWSLYAHGDDGKPYTVRNISFSPAAVSIIAAPTNHGKTLFMLQACLYLAKTTHKHFIYLSTENDAEQLYIRALCANIGYKWKEATNARGNSIKNPRNEIRKYIKGNVGDIFGCSGEYPLTKPVGAYLKLKDEEQLYWDTVAPYVSLLRCGNDVQAICANIATQVEAWKNAGEEVGGIFIDYIQQLRYNSRAYSRTDELQGVCSALNDLAKDTALPVIAAAQLNRDATKTNGDKLDGTELANIGESSGIENIAEDVYLLWQVDRIKTAEFKKGVKFELTSSHWRARRCFESDTDETTRKTGHLYVENLKARDYAAGGYCLLPFYGAAGCAATLTPEQVENGDTITKFTIERK